MSNHQEGAMSVDRLSGAGKVSKPRTLSPHRQFDREPVALGIANPREDMTPIAAAAASRIRANRYGGQMGSYLFGSEDGRVFVISQVKASGEKMLAAHPGWFVGLYAADPKDGSRAICPSAQQVFEDLREHFVDIGFVDPADIYAAVRDAEG